MSKKNIIFLFVLSSLVFLCNDAHATNGFRTVGVGALNRGMAGAGVAVPEDSNTIVINPAGLTQVGSRFDISLDVHATLTHMDTSLAPVGNVTEKQESGRDASFIPTFGYVQDVKDSPWSFGIGAFGLAGCGVEYETSRLGVAANGFDKYTDYAFMTLAPAAAYQVNDKFSIGLAGNIDFSNFDSNSANLSNVETAGAGSMDHAWGGGFTIGFLYDLTDKVTFGLSYMSRQWMQKYDKYSDLVPRLDLAPQLNVGVGIKMTDKWTLASDFKWIGWREISVLGETPSEGGFGWDDQYIYAIGSKYDLTDKWGLRLGYSYGASPIAEDKVFANALFPAVTEHHIGCGVSYKVSDRSEIHFSYDHAVKNSLKDNGLGDSHSVNGKGTIIDLTCHAFIVEWSVKF